MVFFTRTEKKKCLEYIKQKNMHKWEDKQVQCTKTRRQSLIYIGETDISVCEDWHDSKDAENCFKLAWTGCTVIVITKSDILWNNFWHEREAKKICNAKIKFFLFIHIQAHLRHHQVCFRKKLNFWWVLWMEIWGSDPWVKIIPK